MISIYLLGYGRMGKKIHELASGMEVRICGYNDGKSEFENDINVGEADVIIDFSTPESALENILTGLELGLPVVSGTTGWLQDWDEVVDSCEESDGRFFYASNFSRGANILFYINEKLADVMSSNQDYKVSMTEVHHTRKLDKPSGTAASLANDIVEKLDHLSGWVVDDKADGQLPIACQREGDVKGFHEVLYKSDIDEIRISHNALSRDGFALGAIEAAKWLVEQEAGVYGMKNLMGLVE